MYCSKLKNVKMRYKELVLQKTEQIENLLNYLNGTISRGDVTAYEATMERIKTLLGDITSFVSIEAD